MGLVILIYDDGPVTIVEREKKTNGGQRQIQFTIIIYLHYIGFNSQQMFMLKSQVFRVLTFFITKPIVIFTLTEFLIAHWGQ